MHQVELRGSYEQMGRQQAQRLKGWTPPPPEPKMLRFAKQCEEMMGQYARQFLDELPGMAKAAGVDAGGASALEALTGYAAVLDDGYGDWAFRHSPSADMRALQ